MKATGIVTGIANEFKAFITRGNVLELAVGIIIGAAFNKIVSSLVSDIITPLISFVTGFASVTGWNLSDWVITLRKAPEGVEGAVDTAIQAGMFVTYVIDFLITGFAVFLIVKAVNKISEAKTILADEEENNNENEEATITEEVQQKPACPFCKSEINPEAVRCPYCTSLLGGQYQQDYQQEQQQEPPKNSSISN